MEEQTKEILDEINNETDELIISGMEIEGILNLSKFLNLIKINCEINHIKKICKISNSVEVLNCSFNSIKTLTKLPNKLYSLDCAHNNIN